MQLVNQDEQHVELANGAETIRHAAQPAAQLARHVVVELEHRHELAQPARRHAHAMERGDVAGFQAIERARETLDAFAQHFRSFRGLGHGVGGQRASL